MEKPETCECYNYAVKNEGETRKMIEYSAYQKAIDLIQWLRDGIQHFNLDENESQRQHLTKRISEEFPEL